MFRSNILDDNAKIFTFSLVFSYKNTAQNNEDVGEQQKQDNAKGKKRGKGKRGEKNKQQNSKSSSKSNKQETQMTEELETRLAERLEVNGYCRKGFFELKRTLNKSVYTIHGECSENATAIDRKNFINKVEW
ncbi:hypothetical protein ACPUVO_03875 [Pseudocolwellia sp. HL-MZ19]|uniref:hypothetical protein n=1 Tax=Pseudocolwellia sp. HL-MZ19 TaxID=3400846 RepID=UPI003CF1B9AA